MSEKEAMGPRWPRCRRDGLREPPLWRQDGRRAFLKGPRWPEDGSRWCQDATRGPHEDPPGANIGPYPTETEYFEDSLDGPSSGQDARIGAQDRPKTAQEASKGAQDGPREP